MKLPVYILAGGRSSRFGSDKARAMVRGRSLLEHVAAMLDPMASQITVVADRIGKYDDLGYRTIADAKPHLGPVAGLGRALEDLGGERRWLLLCSCDALVIRAAWLRTLVESMSDECDAVAYRGDRWQPMPGLYRSTALPRVIAQLDQDRRSMQSLLQSLCTAALPLPEDWPEHWQANTPADVARIDLDGGSGRPD